MLRFRDLRQSTRWRVFRLAGDRWYEVDGDQRAAAFSFYLLLSLLPLVIALVTAGSLLAERDVATHRVVHLVNRYTPLTLEQQRAAVKTISELLDRRGAISLAAFALLIFGALKFLRALIRTTNRIWHSPTYNWWRLPLKSLGLLAITAGAVLLGILLPVVARLLRQWLAPHLLFPGWAFALTFQIIPWGGFFCGLALIYKLAPSRPTRFSEVWVGALAATGLIWISETLFVIYAVTFANFNLLYGALGGVVALLLWVYLSSCVSVFGVCLCAAQAELRQASHQFADPST